MLSTSLSTVFSDLVEALAAADPQTLEKILQDPTHELQLAIAMHQKVLGEALIEFSEVSPATVEQIGWLLIALSEIAICWKRLT